MFRSAIFVLTVLFLLTLVVSDRGCGQDFFFDDEPPEYLPGLLATYECDGKSITKVDEQVQFDWGVEHLDKRLPAGLPFKATWEGILNLKDDGVFQLQAYLAGTLELKIDDKVVLRAEADTAGWISEQEVKLEFGRHRLEVKYESMESPSASKVALFWRGSTFQLEPLAAQHLQHATIDRERYVESLDKSDLFELGQALSRGLRCAACHKFGVEESVMEAPAITHLQGNLRPSWLINHLTNIPENGNAGEDDETISRRMPHFGLHRNSAAAISAALFDAAEKSERPQDLSRQLAELEKRRGRKDPKVRTSSDPHEGAITFASAGCLACHQVAGLGKANTKIEEVFSGGDLSEISAKRTPEFFTRWLDDPASVNKNHRMPKMQLTLNERFDLQAHLKSLGAAESRNDSRAYGDKSMGIGLIKQHRCAACHELPSSLDASKVSKSAVSEGSDWDGGCLATPNARQFVPGFGLSARERSALKFYYTTQASSGGTSTAPERTSRDATQLLAESNCFSCHDRNNQKGISSQLVDIVEAHPELAVKLAGLSPPAITGVGDKLERTAIKDAISRKADDLRPWLSVRMPRYQFSEFELDVLADYFIAKDRIPEREVELIAPQVSELEYQLASQRLVTAEGFGCQSCHAIGDMETPKVDLKAKGTNLAMLGSRVRPSWFHRWVRNPSRIVARMEMPAINTAIKGVMHDNLDMQLEALWATLNTPDFKPPRPNPVRSVRNHNLPESKDTSAKVLTCVLETTRKNFLRPLAIGLPNRHNVLFDLETGQLSAWWTGDLARQYTRGKTWYWEAGSDFLNNQALESYTLRDAAGNIWRLKPEGQFAVKFDSLEHVEGGIVWRGRLHFQHGQESLWLGFKQLVVSSPVGDSICRVESSLTVPDEMSLLVAVAGKISKTSDGFSVELPGVGRGQLISRSGKLRSDGSDSGQTLILDQDGPDGEPLAWTHILESTLPADSFPEPPVVQRQLHPQVLDVVPGYKAIKLGVPGSEMPISFAWDPNGRGFVGSLKGRVLQMWDADADGYEDSYRLISDEMPTPYGMHFGDRGLDVLAKYGLLRLTPPSKDVLGGNTQAWNTEVVADGWGYTADYHDWAVGLECDSQGNYWIAIPCQQDDRSEAAAYLRGHAVKLTPNTDSADGNRAYRLESFAAGLRFPMGIALDKDGNLFTSDNQGNYNPFNELNHLRRGRRYGFINKLENKNGFSPDFEMPAINIPHPWVRSVNGICFLETPAGMRPGAFGQFEGHLVGCEMNGRSLVRMTLQRVGDTFQGATYLFSKPAGPDEKTFEGPIVCEIAPNGDLYVGNLLDSGWGGGNNTGSIVRLKPSGNLPLGIREVQATATGFEISFTDKVDRTKALEAANYQIRSYIRVSTPAYGGDDQKEKTEQVANADVSEDGRSVTLTLEGLRGNGCVYEINVGAIGLNEVPLFPRQAHYTMRAIPE